MLDSVPVVASVNRNLNSVVDDSVRVGSVVNISIVDGSVSNIFLVEDSALILKTFVVLKSVSVAAFSGRRSSLESADIFAFLDKQRSVVTDSVKEATFSVVGESVDVCSVNDDIVSVINILTFDRSSVKVLFSSLSSTTLEGAFSLLGFVVKSDEGVSSLVFLFKSLPDFGNSVEVDSNSVIEISLKIGSADEDLSCIFVIGSFVDGISVSECETGNSVVTVAIIGSSLFTVAGASLSDLAISVAVSKSSFNNSVVDGLGLVCLVEFSLKAGGSLNGTSVTVGSVIGLLATKISVSPALISMGIFSDDVERLCFHFVYGKPNWILKDISTNTSCMSS